jgi:hypothetical protein
MQNKMKLPVFFFAAIIPPDWGRSNSEQHEPLTRVTKNATDKYIFI